MSTDDTLVAAQPAGCCTWCGHPRHPEPCPQIVRVASGPSGGPGRGVPTEMVPCPCAASNNEEVGR